MQVKAKNVVIIVLCGLILVLSSIFLLGTGDAGLIWKWWFMCFGLGLGTLPLAHVLLSSLADKGYFMSKVLGIALCGFITWLLCSAGVKFTCAACLVITLLIFVLCWGLAYFLCKAKEKRGSGNASAAVDNNYGVELPLIAVEELIFAALLIMWLYLIGFKPEAYGTEKLMDYGFMASLMRTDTLPAADMWYSDGIINYYYGGQYFVVFLTKLFSFELENSYNLFRAFIAAVTFVMAFNIVFTLLYGTVCKRADTGKGESKNKSGNMAAYLGGLLAGVALTFAGNGHYIVFAKFVPMLQEMLGLEVDTYWFSDSTRYIGYTPDVDDKTIHEYPSYSFLLGDLHAHVINLMFVLLFIAILLSWSLKYKRKNNSKAGAGSSETYKPLREIFQPEIIALSVLAGIFRWTNSWDFAIYFGAAGLIILFMNIRKYAKLEGGTGKVAIITIAQAVIAYVISYVVILPFTLGFDSMFEGFAFAENHSRFYQLVILWGIPVATVLVYVISTLLRAKRESAAASSEEGKIFILNRLPLEEMFCVIMGLYAILLIIVPEVIYVKDIYGISYARANTMFKFTYQAFAIFAMLMSYFIVRMIVLEKRGSGVRRFGIVMLVLLLWTGMYFPTAVELWLGDVTVSSNYEGSDATAFIYTDFADIAEGIDWLLENVEGSPVVLEANGNSYTGYNVVSAVTGLPTVLGWYTHEWLWRNDTDDLNVRAADIQTIYTSTDVETVKELIEEYNISYIFIGTNEYEKYAEIGISLDTLTQLGTVVYQSEATDSYAGTYILEVN